MRKPLLCAVAIAAVAASAGDARAQVTRNTTINLQIPELLFIDVTNDNLTLPTPDFAQFDAGYTQTTGHAVRHRGNVAHTIAVAPATGTTIWDGPAGSSKAASDLEWSNDGGGNWSQVTASTNVGTGVQGGFGLNPDIPVSWRSAIAYDEPVGSYQIVVTYTSTPN